MATKEQRAKAARRKAPKPKPPVEEPDVKPSGELFEVPATEPYVAKSEEQESVTVPADGTLLRRDGDPTVYVMSKGQRRPFASAEAFTGSGFGWNEIEVKPSEEIDPIPVGPAVVSARDL